MTAHDALVYLRSALTWPLRRLSLLPSPDLGVAVREWAKRYEGDAHLNCCIRCGTAMLFDCVTNKAEPPCGAGGLTAETCGANDYVSHCPVCGVTKRERNWKRFRAGQIEVVWFDRGGEVLR